MTTKVIVDGEVVSFPSEIIEEPSLLKEILTISSWNDLTDEQRISLKEMLPPSLSETDKDATIGDLLSGGNLTAFSSTNQYVPSGNPVDEIILNLSRGYFSPAAYELRRCRRRAMKAKAKYESTRYYHSILKEIIVFRQCHLAVATFPQLIRLSRQNIQGAEPIDKETELKIHVSAEKMYTSVLNDVKLQVRSATGLLEEDLISSDSDSGDNSTNHTPSTNMLSHNPAYSITPKRFKEILIQHQRRRDAKVNAPDLNVNGIKLSDVMTRTFGGNKKMSGMLKKRKREETMKLSKQKKLKKQSMEAKSSNKNVNGTNAPLSTVQDESNSCITTPLCYFILIRDVMTLASDKTSATIKLLVADWLSSAEASRYMWTTTRTNWHQLVDSALQYMSSKHEYPDDTVSTVPPVDFKDDLWVWKGFDSSEEEDQLLGDMCKKWLEDVVEKNDATSCPALADDNTTFHSQEGRRFLYSHQAFVYTINGRRYTVPPVKGSTGPTKEGRVAREHCLLKSERPPQVTLLALTRDAVARLPDGRGTRNVVCNLLRDSQYLAHVVTDAQINAAVSGALDRLHYEADPCVKFDASLRQWIYLHGNRSVQELERIHAEQLGAPRKKRERGIKKPKSKSMEARQKTVSSKYNIGSPAEAEGNFPATDSVDSGSAACLSVAVNDVNAASPHLDLTSPLVINEQVVSANVKPKQIPNKKRPKKNKSVAVGDDLSQKMKSAALAGNSRTRTIQLTQKQLVEMTRKMGNPPNTRVPREVLITHADNSGSLENPSIAQKGYMKTTKSTTAIQQHSQPSLKLILKPASGDQQKPIAELVRVVEPSLASNQRFNSNTKQQALTVEALRRLSEQLSAVSSRPIKIVQQNVSVNGKSPNQPSYQGSRSLNIATQVEPKARPTMNPDRLINAPSRMTIAHVASPIDSMPSASTPLGGASSPAATQTVHITANSKGDAVVNRQQVNDITRNVTQAPQVVHVVHRPHGARISTGATTEQTKKASQTQNIQVLQGKPQTLQIMSGGKIQTVQVLQQHKVTNTEAMKQIVPNIERSLPFANALPAISSVSNPSDGP